ncbi:hypothetical protein GGS26DRAFT_592470 [Hypomontagnella submonticulosa]|nr:hypothetical protein GGS26DRAFT_592470 [Hypomontagnella submonticulosa]
MDYSYMSGASSAYEHPYWPTSTAMTRGTSYGSSFSDYSRSSNEQYDAALSPTSEGMGNLDFSGVPDGLTYISDTHTYDTSTQPEEQDLIQYYVFDAGGDSGQAHWRLKPGYTPTARYPETMPVSANSDVPPPASVTSGKYVCLEPFCNATPFGRKADLQRHVLHKHRDASHKKAFFCDFKKCPRSKQPFYRLDHCREHHRDFHKEDTPRRGPNKESAKWWETRNVDKRWWRCAKCLSRISIETKGFECSKCKTTCEPERRKLRGYE